jgi:hypothetical protein
VRIVGILNWYDESPSWLGACTASMARAGMTHIVAVDGAYGLFPDGIRHPRSGTEQYAAIIEVCQAMEIGLTLHSPAEAYPGNECEKRSHGFMLAEQVAEAGDWYFLMDADQVITTSHNLHRSLAETEFDVAEALFYTRGVGQEMNGQRALWPCRCIFRAIPGLRVRDRHYSYQLPDGRDLWGDPPYEPAAVTLVEVEHRSQWRSKPRQLAQNQYYERRDEAGAENPERLLEEPHV